MAVNCSISLCDERIFGLPIFTTLIMLCCSALKIHLLSSILHGTCSIHFIQTVILECINESTNLYHTMTVLLEYNDRSLQFSINA